MYFVLQHNLYPCVLQLLVLTITTCTTPYTNVTKTRVKTYSSSKATERDPEERLQNQNVEFTIVHSRFYNKSLIIIQKRTNTKTDWPRMIFKAQYWPLRLYCFLVLFWRQTKESSEFSTSQKWPPRDSSVQCLLGNTGSLISRQKRRKSFLNVLWHSASLVTVPSE